MTTQILGISGSLRAGSYNTALLRTAGELLVDAGVAFDIARIDDLPHFNADLGEVESVERFKAQIAAADGLLIATPEYNHGIPGPLKNAIDWASRPAFESVFVHKPFGVMGASKSVVGTARVQGYLKMVMLGMLAVPFPGLEVLVGRAADKFEDGKLVDEDTRKFLTSYIESFVAFVERTR